MTHDNGLHGPTQLDRADAWRLLRGQNIGRLAVSVDGRPDVFPVNFLASDDEIVLRTAPGSKLDSIAANPHVAFETDGVGSTHAWSVVVRGEARLLDEADFSARVSPTALWTWQGHDAALFIAIAPTDVTGRQFHRD